MLALLQCSVPPMVHELKDAGGARINWTLLVSLVQWFDTAELSVSFNGGSVDVKDCRRWIHANTVALTKTIVAMLTEMS